MRQLKNQLLSLEFSEIDLFLLYLSCGRGRPASPQLRVSYQNIKDSTKNFTSWIESFLMCVSTYKVIFLDLLLSRKRRIVVDTKSRTNSPKQTNFVVDWCRNPANMMRAIQEIPCCTNSLWWHPANLNLSVSAILAERERESISYKYLRYGGRLILHFTCISACMCIQQGLQPRSQT